MTNQYAPPPPVLTNKAKRKTINRKKNFMTSPLSITPEVAENIYIIQ